MDTNETNLGSISNILSQLSRIPKHSEQIYLDYTNEPLSPVQSNISCIKYVVNINTEYGYEKVELIQLNN